MDLEASVAYVCSVCQAASSGGKVNVNLGLWLSQLGGGGQGQEADGGGMLITGGKYRARKGRIFNCPELLSHGIAAQARK